MDELKLLPCPFCGKQPKEEWHQWRDGTLQIACDNPACPADGIYTGLLKPEETRKAWNTRPAETALAQRVSALEQMVARLAQIAAAFLEGVSEEWAQTDIHQAALTDWRNVGGAEIAARAMVEVKDGEK